MTIDFRTNDFSVFRKYDLAKNRIMYCGQIPSDAPKLPLHSIDIVKFDSDTWGCNVLDMTGHGVASYWGTLVEIEEFFMNTYALQMNVFDDKGVITQ